MHVLYIVPVKLEIPPSTLTICDIVNIQFGESGDGSAEMSGLSGDGSDFLLNGDGSAFLLSGDGSANDVLMILLNATDPQVNLSPNSTTIVTVQSKSCTILGECRALWGERERVPRRSMRCNTTTNRQKSPLNSQDGGSLMLAPTSYDVC